MRDSAGFTQAEVQQQTLEEQYRLYGERMHELWETVETLQRLIYTGEWETMDIGRITPAHASQNFFTARSEPGGYVIQTRKTYTLPDGSSNVAAFLSGIENLDYPYTHTPSDSWGIMNRVVVNLPGEGTAFYDEYSNGRASLEVVTGVFWGNYRELLTEHMGRDFTRPPERALPGKNPEFPSWETPKKQKKISDTCVTHGVSDTLGNET